MNNDHSFIAERALAQHCPELIGGTAPNEGATDELREEFAANLTNSLAPRLHALFAGKPVSIRHDPGKTIAASALSKAAEPRSANFAIECGGAGINLLVSLPLDTAIDLTDRFFGGSGGSEKEGIETLSKSALMVIEKVALGVSQAVAASAFQNEHAAVLRHHRTASRLEIFAPKDRCISWDFCIEQDGAEEWKMLVAAPLDVIDALPQSVGAAVSPSAAKRRAEPTDNPFAEIPFSLRAVLAEFNMPLSRLADLHVDQTIPLALAREVPLRLSGQTIAHGKIGSEEDKIALQLVRLTHGETQS